ncbi:MAG TPA: hypothetical protein VLT87_24590 [Thermoanaerobaculia bacterium]|nr:hypothetical protein [Thermoanaerobaculia bacterium]
MFCPECGFEGEEDVALCPDCEVELEKESEEEGPPAEVRFVPLVEATEVDFFAWATSRLEEAGIPWFVQSEPSSGRLARDGGEARPEAGSKVAVVYVAEDLVEKARALVMDGVAVRV